MAENAIRPPKQIGLNELNKEGWESWLESFEWYEIATQLSSKAPEVPVAIFMAAMGREAQNIFKTFDLNNADKNNLSIVKDKFNNHFSQNLNTTIERFKFNQMKQKENESFNDFLTRIKLQIANCKYAVMSDELLKDRIVVGIINNDIKERLLSEADLNLEKATQICIACENATNQMKHVLSDSDKQVAVTKMNSKKWEDRKEQRKENTTNQSHKIIENCRNCGRSHKINQCPAYQKRCNKCKKLSHFANLCRSQNTNSYKVRQIVGSPEPEMIQEFVIQSVENTNLTEEWYEEVKIKGKKINMKLDTGAQCNVLPLSLAGRLNLEIQRCSVKSLISFSGHRIPVEGQSLAMCMVKNMTAYIRFIISRDNICSILGRQTCSNLGLVKREYQEVFEGIGCLKGYEYEAKFQTSDMNIQRNKTKEPMIIKNIPSLPWEIVAADIFSIKGKNYLLITDNYSGFIDFKEMKTMNSAETIESLKKWFLALLETDNGPNFTSRDFKDFQKKWLFDHQTSSPLYPKSNGLAERAVQTAKNLIRKCLDSRQEVELALLNFYNTTRDGLSSPAQCLFSRRTRTLLPTSTHQLEPEIQKGHTQNQQQQKALLRQFSLTRILQAQKCRVHTGIAVLTTTKELSFHATFPFGHLAENPHTQNLRNKREKQKTHYDKTAKTTRGFKEGEKIMLKQHHREWSPARVTQEVAPRSYKVQTTTGEYRRNRSFMRHTNLESPKVFSIAPKQERKMYKSGICTSAAAVQVRPLYKSDRCTNVGDVQLRVWQMYKCECLQERVIQMYKCGRCTRAAGVQVRQMYKSGICTSSNAVQKKVRQMYKSGRCTSAVAKQERHKVFLPRTRINVRKPPLAPR
ncbi:K02A2.6-like [Cordylochernes scorpioides]|uniref:K02A2.6-like n=1 Tax=Cordylochernes scorpioides TaxID=51811 RepID=A0ABY6K7Q6_9ARAC|nr:K02A2.6-like [Cordylochernes scorpioides]